MENQEPDSTRPSPQAAISESESIQQEPQAQHGSIEYAGFWIRFLASLLDSIILLMVIVPLLLVIYGPGVFFVTESPGLAYDLINYVLPIVAVIVFWRYRSATPGKIMMGIYIVDANTLGQPSFGKLCLRYLGYYVSIIPLMLGFIWIGIDKRKQGFHDKIAQTLVIKQSGQASAGAEKQGAAEIAERDAPSAVDDAAQVASRPDPWKE